MFIEHPTTDFLACELPCWIRTLHCPLSKSIPSAHRGNTLGCQWVSSCYKRSQRQHTWLHVGLFLLNEYNFTIIFIWIAWWQYFWVSRNAVGPTVPWYICAQLWLLPQATFAVRAGHIQQSGAISQLTTIADWQQSQRVYSNIMESACGWQTIEARRVGSRLRALVISSQSPRDPFFLLFPCRQSLIHRPLSLRSLKCEMRAISAFW